MMGFQLQIILLVSAVIYLAAIIHFIRTKGMDLYRSIIWFLQAAVLLVMAVLPSLVKGMSSLVRSKTPSNFVFLLLIAFLLLNCLSMSASLSRQHERIKHMVQSVAILENRLLKLEKEMQELREDIGKSGSDEE